MLTVLDLVWRPEHNDFVFNQKALMDILKDRENAKRSVARIFDPIEFLTPFPVRVK